MIPVFSHFEKFESFDFWITTDFRCGLVLELKVVDTETKLFSEFADTLANWSRRQDPRLLVRTILKGQNCFDSESTTSRGPVMQTLGFTKNTVFLSFETSCTDSWTKALKLLKSRSSKSVDSSFRLLIEALRDFRNLGFDFQVLPDEHYPKDLFVDAKPWVVCDSIIDTGSEYRACVRILKPKFQDVDTDTLQNALLSLPKPFVLQTSLQRLGAPETQVMVARRIKQSQSMTGLVNEEKLSALEQISSNTSIKGDSLFNLETVLTLERLSISDLKADLSSSKNILESLGEAKIETFGTLPTLASTMVGSPQHIPFLETGSNLSYYSPLFAKGCSLNSKISSSALLIHRKDNSLDEIDLLSPNHQNANAVIVGASGRGKSAFVGTLTQALMNDSNTRVIKVDVGGSHSKECKLLDGLEHRISLDQPSGINPFAAIPISKNEEATRSILSNFLSVLVLEDSETSLPKIARVEIDNLLKDYISSKPENPCLDSFYKFSKTFSRKGLLSRWCTGGIYAKAFQANEHRHTARLSYYNFSEIFQAADPDFAQAGMAAVLAQFNLEMQAYPDQRIILICDETPFFIQKCFEFFKFSTANVRKFGASVILIVQMSKDLILKNDPGLIENSFHRILLSIDGEAVDFQSRFKLTDDQLSSVRSLKTVPREYSELFYQVGEYGFQARLKLTPAEYFQITTSQSEKMKIERLMTHVPGLTLKEAISCLAI